MATRGAEKQAKRRARAQVQAETERARRTQAIRKRLLAGLAVIVLALAGVFALANHAGNGSPRGAKVNQPGAYAHAVGNPGPGARAPGVNLPSTAGGTFSLGAQKAKTTLLYFQEGISCQPCWDQMKEIEKQWGRFRALGVTQMVSITGNDLGALRQKVSDERISTPVLADPGLKASKAYEANKYGMMGDSADGHSFILVGPRGNILYRADYGGAPDYTMYLPVPALLADMRKGLRERRSPA